jgi:EAL domain-containing protein (putative c-di-GMP-specific phosphodiesterase class I)
MARGLGIQVIAEGVETAEQKRFATEAGCHYTQGFFTGRPVPLHDFRGKPAGTAVEI